MKVGNQKVVSLTYELRQNDAAGEIIQKVEKDRPFVYLFGVGGLLPKFEESLSGLAVATNSVLAFRLRKVMDNPVKKQLSILTKKSLKLMVKLTKIY